MKKLLAVALGGVLGALVRYLTVAKGDEIALFLVNIAGVVVAGFFAYRLNSSELTKVFLIPGFAGGLTTFSSVAVLHAQQSSIKMVIYFHTMVLISIFSLFIVKPKVRT